MGRKTSLGIWTGLGLLALGSVLINPFENVEGRIREIKTREVPVYEFASQEKGIYLGEEKYGNWFTVSKLEELGLNLAEGDSVQISRNWERPRFTLELSRRGLIFKRGEYFGKSIHKYQERGDLGPSGVPETPGKIN
ncbi:hypothetical protein HOD88_03245 [archaeon]|jgi:hypothetical protein|nr:hypothetical protein [archaeon]